MSEFTDCYLILQNDIEKIKTGLESNEIDGSFVIIPGNKDSFIPLLMKRPLHEFVKIFPDIIIGEYEYSDESHLKLQIFIGENKIFSIYKTVALFSDNLQDEVFYDKVKLIKYFSINDKDLVLLDSLGKETVDCLSIIKSIFRIENSEYISTAELLNSISKFKNERPTAIIINKKDWGKSIKLSPNEWCSSDDAPDYMYLPLPNFTIYKDELKKILEKNIKYWHAFKNYRGPDDLKDYWSMYYFYRNNLPIRYKFLIARLINYCYDQKRYSKYDLDKNFDKTVECCVFLLSKENKNIRKLNDLSDDSFLITERVK